MNTVYHEIKMDNHQNIPDCLGKKEYSIQVYFMVHVCFGSSSFSYFEGETLYIYVFIYIIYIYIIHISIIYLLHTYICQPIKHKMIVIECN